MSGGDGPPLGPPPRPSVPAPPFGDDCWSLPPSSSARSAGVAVHDVPYYELYLDTQRSFYTPSDRPTRQSWQALCAHSDRTCGLILHLGRPNPEPDDS